MSDDPTRLRDLALPLGTPPQALRELAAARLGVPLDAIAEVRLRKQSVDARGHAPKRICTVDVWLVGQEVPPEERPSLALPARVRPLRPGEAPIIVGSGPAGLWAAIRFVQAGIPVILLERGGALPTRHAAVRALRRSGDLDPESNLCFGAGGAGTYSDGKLYTRKRDSRVQRVYEDLVALGAPEQILVEAHPHVGTNRLIKILGRLEDFLAEAGCDVRYGARVVDLLQDQGGRVAGVRLDDGTELTGPAVVLATGHSARDVYTHLHGLGVPMERKAFAVGARVEHQQAQIDRIQYGQLAGHPELEPAEYFLTAQVGPRGVYSFCMCPGGFVIPTTTELGHLNVNGMSNHKRGSRFANSALVVTVEPGDFWLERPGDLDHLGPLAGMALQRHLEARAFAAGGGGYRAPAQRLTDYLAGRAGDLPDDTSYRPGIAPADLKAVLPARVADPLARAILKFEQRMQGFLTEDAILIGVETTTSSPIRVVRDEQTLMSPGFSGLYPTGEGAGYAGGIVSSAIDGLRVAEAVLATLPVT
ncbi:MAG: FAD-dependent oxidoreductase [Deltaproteobacteria bacterium HGW-Deltaproteobacteria-14]|nr:MAG: FAD-dependent oxidoreductase [Deltaproteobacteria bacterium HGW-Deltaproteobacteria-14]